jgi:hypothetical protein
MVLDKSFSTFTSWHAGVPYHVAAAIRFAAGHSISSLTPDRDWSVQAADAVDSHHSPVLRTKI